MEFEEMETPLLAGRTNDDDNNNTKLSESKDPARPTLSSGPLLEDDEENTEFSRLIAQRSSSHAEIMMYPNGDTHQEFWFGTNQQQQQRYNDPQYFEDGRTRHQERRNIYYVRRKFEILLASTCCLMFVGLLWSSYLSHAWSQSRLILELSLSSQGTSTPSSSVRQTLSLGRATTLASYLQVLQTSLSHHPLSISWTEQLCVLLLLILLWMGALIVPCTFMVLAPSWIILDAQPHHKVDLERRVLSESASKLRSYLEVSVRFGLLVIYLQLLHDLILSNIEWDWSAGGKVHVRQQHMNGFVSYFVAMTSAILTVVVLRFPPTLTKEGHAPSQTTDMGLPNGLEYEDPSTSSQDEEVEPTPAPQQPLPLRTPPRQAFRLRFPRSLRRQQDPNSSLNDPLLGHIDEADEELEDGTAEDGDDDEEEQVSMTLLEESPPAAAARSTIDIINPSSSTRSKNGSSSEDIPATGESGAGSEVNNHAGTSTATVANTSSLHSKKRSNHSITFCHKLVVFQLGLLTLVLWMLCWYTPFVQVIWYDSPSITFLPSNTRHSNRLFWSQIPVALWKQGHQSETDAWFLALLQVWMALTLLVVPLLASVLGLLVWLGEGSWCTRSRQYLYCIQPALGGFVASTALLSLPLVLKVTNPIQGSDSVFLQGSTDGSSSDALHFLGDSSCLQAIPAQVHLLSGGWSYILHSVSLEVFVSLTLRWSLLG